MSKSTKFFLVLCFILISLGLLLCGISFCFGVRFTDLNTVFENSKIISYFYRSDNSDLSKDVLIWEESENIGEKFTELEIENKDKYPLTSINLESDRCKILLKKGDDLKVKFANLLKENLSCSLSKKGLLTIKDTPSFGLFNILERKNYSENGIIEVYIPENITLENFLATVNYGSLVFQENNITCETLKLKNLNGNILGEKIISQNSTISNEYGTILLSGELCGESDIYCNSGRIELLLKNTFSYTEDKGMGSIIINGKSSTNYLKKSNIEETNNLDIQCKLGTVIIENQ